MNVCTEEMFLKDVPNHTMTIIKDDGVNRHIKFSKNGSSVYRFDLITWAGKLCIDGDCGTYVFSRIYDMFEFFRMDENDFNHSKERTLNINPMYWGEKLNSISKDGGYKEYSENLMKSVMLDYVKSYWEFENEDQEQEVRQQLEDEVFSCFENNEGHDYALADDFKSEYGHEFIDLWDYSFKEYTFHYLWCLYAIVYGIQMYDQSKLEKVA
ncbi:hypothetical protein A3715_10370 [Oleiphilus sp. HI0009]|nr:hypothetical protein A3715_10370 [Oleiphilus sp. HI0009]